MKRLLLTTASIIALGLVTPAIAQTSQTSNSPSYSSSTTAPASASKSTSTSASSDMHSTKSGHRHAAKSSHTRDAQTALKAQGLYTGNIDGKNGPMTRNAIAQFQHKQGLKENGKLDRETRSKLMASNNASGGASSTMTSTGSTGSSSTVATSSRGVTSPPSSGSVGNGAKMPNERGYTSTRRTGG